MIHRFSNNSWHRRGESMHSPEFKAWIAQVLRDAARSSNGVGELTTGTNRRNTRATRVFRETDNDAECRTLAGHGTIFVPKCYEEKYAYPLIVWLNDPRSDRSVFQSFLMGLSDRNYLGFTPDETTSAEMIEAARDNSAAGHSASIDALSRLHEAVKAIRHDVNIHTERVFLAGMGDGANAALELFLTRPEWFGGAIVLEGHFPNDVSPLRKLEEARGKRVFLANRIDQSGQTDPDGHFEDIGQLLNSAGMSVETRSYDSLDPLVPQRLADINEWVMDGVCTLV